MRFFSYICHNCEVIAKQKGEEYQGQVNLDIRPILKGHAILKHKCFTCGMVEIVTLGDTPTNKEEFKKMVIKQSKIAES